MADTLPHPASTTPEETPVGDLVDLAKHRETRIPPPADSRAVVMPAAVPALPEDPEGDLPWFPLWMRSREGWRSQRDWTIRRARRGTRRWVRRQRTDRGHLAQARRGARRAREYVVGFEGVHVQAAAHQAHSATREARDAARRARYALLPAAKRAAQQHADRAQTAAIAAVAAHKQAKKDRSRARNLRALAVYGPTGAALGGGYAWDGWLGLTAAVLAAFTAAAIAGRKPHEEPTWSADWRTLGDGDRMTGSMLDKAFQAAKVIGGDEALRLLVDPMRDADAWLARFDLPPGVTAKKAMRALEEIAAALGVEAAQVHLSKDGRAGRLELYVTDRLPFTGDPQPGPLLALAGRPMNFWGRIPIGPTVRGGEFGISVVERSGLIGGEPGAGKSASGNTILLAAALDPRVILVLADGKGGGDLEPFEPLCEAFEGDADPEAFLQLLDDVIRDMRFRYALLKKLGRRKVTEELANAYPELRQKLLWVDELMFYTTDEELGKKITKRLRNIVSRGRAAGIITFAATQKPGSDVVDTSLRDLLSIRWALRCTTPEASDTILGKGAAAAGYSAKTIEPEMRGAGLLWSEGNVPVLVRAHYYTDDQVTALLQLAYRLRQAAGTLPTAGPTLVEQLRELGTDGRILAVLVEEFERRAGEWLPTSVLLAVLAAAGMGDVTAERLAALLPRSEADKRKREWAGGRVSGYPRQLVVDTAEKRVANG